jgi:hypothetical protein
VTVVTRSDRAGNCPEEPTGVTSNQRSRRPRVRPLPKGNTLYTPGASAARQATERRSARAAIYLHQLPVWVAPLVVVVLLIAGLAVKGPGGGVALAGLALVLGWLATLSWPQLSASARIGRVVAVLIVLGLAGLQAAR